MDQMRNISPKEIIGAQRRLFKTTKVLSSCLPVGRIDVLIIDKLGSVAKETTEVVKSMRAYAESTSIRRIYIRDLSNGAGGNGSGAGYADFVSARVVQKTDRSKTYNAGIAASDPRIGATPIYYDTDAEALEACFKTIEDVPVSDIKLAYIKDAKSFDEIVVSPLLLKDMKSYQMSPTADGWGNMRLDELGNIISPFRYRKEKKTFMTSAKSFVSEFFCFGF